MFSKKNIVLLLALLSLTSCKKGVDDEITPAVTSNTSRVENAIATPSETLALVETNYIPPMETTTVIIPDEKKVVYNFDEQEDLSFCEICVNNILASNIIPDGSYKVSFQDINSDKKPELLLLDLNNKFTDDTYAVSAYVVSTCEKLGEYYDTLDSSLAVYNTPEEVYCGIEIAGEGYYKLAFLPDCTISFENIFKTEKVSEDSFPVIYYNSTEIAVEDYLTLMDSLFPSNYIAPRPPIYSCGLTFDETTKERQKELLLDALARYIMDNGEF